VLMVDAHVSFARARSTNSALERAHRIGSDEDRRHPRIGPIRRIASTHRKPHQSDEIDQRRVPQPVTMVVALGSCQGRRTTCTVVCPGRGVERSVTDARSQSRRGKRSSRRRGRMPKSRLSRSRQFGSAARGRAHVAQRLGIRATAAPRVAPRRVSTFSVRAASRESRVGVPESEPLRDRAPDPRAAASNCREIATTLDLAFVPSRRSFFYHGVTESARRSRTFRLPLPRTHDRASRSSSLTTAQPRRHVTAGGPFAGAISSDWCGFRWVLANVRQWARFEG